MNDSRPPRTPIIAPGGIELLAADMTAHFAADVTLGSAQAHLAEIGQWLPIDGNLQSTLGDLILQNSTGPLRLGYGAWRDLLLGVQFTNGRGDLISAGGQTVKNVAGYDLTKFIVGSAGVFGKIITLTTRTYRRPNGALVAQFPADVRIVSKLMPTALRPQWAMLTADGVYCGYLGDERTLGYYRSTLQQAEPISVIERSMEEDIADRAKRWRTEGELAFRASVPPARLGELAAKLAGISWAADAAFGIVIGSHIGPESKETIRKAVENVGGSVRFLAASNVASPTVDFSTSPVEQQIIEKLKIAFGQEK